MDKIKREAQESKKFYFDMIDGTNLVALTLRNVALAEAMIHNNSTYLKADDVKVEKKVTKTGKLKQHGSVAYCVTRLKNALEKNCSDEEYREIMFDVVASIDAANSTHLNSDGVGRDEIADRIAGIDRKTLLDMLKNPEKRGYDLIEIIREKTHAKDEKHRARLNYSFATKFCYNACFYIFEGMAEQDNFSIYDSVAQKAVLKYIKHYNLPFSQKDLLDYSKYHEVIGKIIELAGDAISRNGFDHLIWYFYKGRD